MKRIPILCFPCILWFILFRGSIPWVIWDIIWDIARAYPKWDYLRT